MVAIRRSYLAKIVLVLVLPLLLIFMGLKDHPAVTGDPLILNIIDRVGLVTVRLLQVEIPVGQQVRVANLAEKLTQEDRARLEKGQLKILDTYQALDLAVRVTAGEITPPGENFFCIITNTPLFFKELNSEERGLLLREVTRAALVLKAKLVVDCSASDLARLEQNGPKTLQEAKNGGLIRMVIFDGGHHLPSMGLDPEILLLPVTKNAEGDLLAAHSYVRDAVPVKKVREIIENLGTCSVIAKIPRELALVKTPQAVGKIAGKVLLALISENKNEQFNPDESRFHYELGKVVSGSRFLIAPNGTMLLSVPSHNTEPDKFLTARIQENVLNLTENYYPKKVYLAVIYGTCDYRRLVQSDETRMDFLSDFELPVNLVNVPLAVPDLWWSRILQAFS